MIPPSTHVAHVKVAIVWPSLVPIGCAHHVQSCQCQCAPRVPKLPMFMMTSCAKVGHVKVPF